MSLDLHSNVLVLIPIHRLPLTAVGRFSVERTCDVLSQWKVAFLCPERLKAAIGSIKWPRSDIQVLSYPNDYFESVDGYNRLLMSEDFYKGLLPHEYLLIVQPDALVISDQLAYWCDQNWSFIGAPWFKGFDKTTTDELIGVGNGGFSLRKVQDCLEALKNNTPSFLLKAFLKDPVRFVRDFWVRARKRYKILPNYNEDHFFGALAPWLNPGFRVPSPKVALAFAFEVKPQTMYAMNGHELPFGCHAFERYDYSFWKTRLDGMPNYGRAQVK